MSPDLSERVIDVAAAVTRSVAMVAEVADGTDVPRQQAAVICGWHAGPSAHPHFFFLRGTHLPPPIQRKGEESSMSWFPQIPFWGPARRVPASGLQRVQAGGGTQTPLSPGPLYTQPEDRCCMLQATPWLFVHRMTFPALSLPQEKRTIFDRYIGISRIIVCNNEWC